MEKFNHEGTWDLILGLLSQLTDINYKDKAQRGKAGRGGGGGDKVGG